MPGRRARIAAIGKNHGADDAAVQQVVAIWQRQASFRAVQQRLRELITGHTFGCMHQEPATILGVPTAVLDVLAAVDDQPGSGLADLKCFHAAIAADF